MKAVKW